MTVQDNQFESMKKLQTIGILFDIFTDIKISKRIITQYCSLLKIQILAMNGLEKR